MQKFKNPDFVSKIVALVFLAALFVAVELAVPGFYSQLMYLTTSKDELIKYLQGFGVWAIAVSFCLDVLINATGFLPSIFISTVNGLVFGLPLGITVSWLAETVGVTISFFLMRFFFRSGAEALIEKSNALQHLDNASGDKGFWWMTVARMLPYVPSGILTAVGAISKISARDYFLANLVGKFPSTALEVVVGHDLVNLHQHYKRLLVWVVLGVLIFAAAKYWNKRKG